MRKVFLRNLAAGIVGLSMTVQSVVADEALIAAVKEKENTPPVRVQGDILDYSGAGLVLRSFAGREETYAAARVVSLETNWPAGYTAGQDLVKQGKFEEALASYKGAIAAEMRPWVVRRVTAGSVRAFLESKQLERAGETFLSLFKQDRQTPHFDAIPLSWSPQIPNSQWQAVAERWLKDETSPAARLLGASWLLAQGDRGKSLAALQTLGEYSDERIARLATMQLWRTQIVTATVADTDRWAKQIEALPASLRAGPYFVLGAAQVQQQRFEEGALSLLRVPILFPDQRELAAEALLAAGKSLEKLARPTDAHGLYRELVTQYASSPLAADAEARLKKPVAP